MPHLLVPPIKITRIAKLKGLHDSAQRYLFNINKKMEMIFHQTVSIKAERVSALVLRKKGKELLHIFIIKEYTLPSISSGDNMIQSSWKMDSRSTSHGELFIKEG
jgi:hypothetical protein